MTTDIKAFTAATLQRIARSFAASLLALIGSDTFNAFHTSWLDKLGTSAGAGLVTLLLCIIGGATNGAGPSFGTVEVTSPPAPPVGA